jgi:hypothetical protein
LTYFNIIVVLYNSYESNLSILSIIDKIEELDSSNLKFRNLYLFDNSCSDEHSRFISEKYKRYVDRENVSYIKADTNVGTSGAFSFVSNLCFSDDYLLFLDQDTNVGIDYFNLLYHLSLSTLAPVIVPKIYHGGIRISPLFITQFGSISDVNSSNNIIRTAITSGTLIRNSTFKSLLPVPNEFWLDYFDHYIFYTLGKFNIEVNILDVSFEHNLSIYEGPPASYQRTFSQLSSERVFVGYFGRIAVAYFYLRLMSRIIKYRNIRFTASLIRWFFD